MEEVLKIAENGQWSLEKAVDKKAADAARAQEIQAFIERQKQKLAQQAAAPRPAATGPNYPAGMRPVSPQGSSSSTMPSKEQVAAVRAVIDRQNASQPGGINVNALPAHLRHLVPGATSNANAPGRMAEQGAADVAKLSAQQANDDERAKLMNDRKKAWNATVEFLANRGDKGYQNIRSKMEAQRAVQESQATGTPVKPKPRELLPPPTPGTFHNQGHTTQGKLVSKPVRYKDKHTGEDKFGRVTQAEQHHWSWDHNNKKWNHIKTTLGSPTIK